MPFENFSQSIWVANSNGEYDIVGGKVEPDFNNGQFHDNNAYWLVFDVFEDVIFESVEVYSQQSGAHVIEILDSEGNLVEAFTQFLSEGFNVFNLNCFFLQVIIMKLNLAVTSRFYGEMIVERM